MFEWMDRTFLGVAAWKYLAILGLLLGALIAKAIVEHLLRRYFRAMLAAKGLSHLERATAAADRALGFLCFALIVYLALPLIELPPDALTIARVAARALTATGGVWLAFRVLDVLFDLLAGRAEATEGKLDDQLVPILRRTVKVFAAVIGGLFVLQNLDVDVGSLLAGLGLGGLAFALAARDTVANFFGSVMIFIDKPFTIGDWIQMGEHEGVVEEVGFRTSRVRTFRDSLLTVPNALMTTAVIENYGARRFRRYNTTLGITYDTPPARVLAMCDGIRAVIAAHPDMRHDYVVVEFEQFGASSLQILVYCFFKTDTWTGELRARTELNLQIMRLAERLGVRFAFPTQTLHLESAVPPAAPPPPRAPSERELAGIVAAFGPGGAEHRARLTSGKPAQPAIDHTAGSTGDGEGG